MGTLSFRNWQYKLIAIVLFISWIAFLKTSMISDHPVWRTFEGLYFAISLFLVGGLDIGFPTEGPDYVLVTLWICYFMAPLLTLSFVYQFVQEKILNQFSPFIRNHTIICGLGRNGELIYELVRENFPNRHKIVLIEKKENNPFSELLEKDRNTWWLKSDFTKPPVLQQAKVHKANRVYITTNMDLENIEATVAILDSPKIPADLLLFCHLGNPELHQNFGATIFKERKFRTVYVFNGYQCVAKRFYEDWLLKKMKFDPAGTIFVILGFGRFGKMVYSFLASDEKRHPADEIVIATIKQNIDLDKLNYDWSSTDEISCKIHSPFYTDIHSPSCWEQLNKLAEKSGKKMVLLICRDDDIGNLNLAISMKLRGPQQLKSSIIFCRMYHHTAKEINDILERRITKNLSRDILIFPMQSELKTAFIHELFS